MSAYSYANRLTIIEQHEAREREQREAKWLAFAQATRANYEAANRMNAEVIRAAAQRNEEYIRAAAQRNEEYIRAQKQIG